MKVILLQEIKGKGKKGTLLDVSEGYARNFLIPRKLAVQADAQALTELKNAEVAKQHKIEIEKNAARDIASKIEGQTVKLFAKAGQNGKLFGKITSKEISESINGAFDVKIDKRKIKLESEIKAFGTYNCEIKLYNGITAHIYIIISEKE